ncbi:hypothetical protein [Marinobacterium rhizophilum]|uniref:hypothetical protein n=1 Tax=Marinobacterium rhizophilum TaxID=420402 RepID=UPI0003821705|nr:hypothetical protein [Marinobacterium rhizophilum]
MSAVQHHITAIPSPLRRRLLLQLAMILTCGLLLSSGYLWFGASQDARVQTIDAGDKLMRQSAVLLQPLLLADDRVSLNYLLNELGDQPEVRGIALYNQTNELVARSGETEGPLERELILEREQQSLGRMLFWLDPAPARAQRLAQLILVASLWIASALAALLTLAVALNARPAPQPDAQDPNETVPLDAESGDTAQYDEVLADSAQAETRQAEDSLSEDPDSSEAMQRERAFEEDTQDDDEFDQEDDQDNAKDRHAPREESGFEGLLDLLRPVKQRLMPRFTPSVPQQDDTDRSHEPSFIDEALEFDDDDSTPVEPPRPSAPNPLRERAETQLGLYSFEHELELILAPHEARYLLLVDAASGHAEYVGADERADLLAQYSQCAQQIAEIYSGEIEPQDNGDLHIWFREPTDDDAHGANALCAAKLFALLYRAFNQRRIRNFLPVLNLHIALVRGNVNTPSLMLEEAQFLTRSTQSNELISHTALTEVPDLKDNLLEHADIRREDEDKVLIHRLSEDYEELLERQASHLVSKFD